MRTTGNDETEEAADRRQVFLRWVLWTWLAVVCLGGCFGLGLFYGLMRGTEEGYRRQYQQERELVEPILAKEPAFAEVAIHRRSNGGIYLLGQVPTAQDYSRLRESVIRAVGEPRAKEILLAVDARSGDIDSLR
jgi:hypothetical protein